MTKVNKTTLYIVATPIGNLEDITLRALRILKEVDYILCEDTRVTKKLLDHYKIDKPLISYHQHSGENKYQKILELFEKGNNLALVSDAGTPGISDPGNELISHIMKSELRDRVDIVPMPGPSAVISAASISGFPTDSFLFLGFPPHKNKRNKFFQKAIESEDTVIFYESSHRIIKSLEQLREFIDGENYDIVVCRELTKMFESVYRGDIDEVIESVQRDKVKGEFVVILHKAK